MKKMKRILAGLLCLCMMASVLPMGAAATDAVEELKLEIMNLTSSGYEDSDAYIVSENSNAFALQVKAGNYFQVGGPEDGWVAFRLGELKAGYYDGMLSHITAASGSKFKFYIVPEKEEKTAIANEIANAEVAVEVDFYNGTGNVTDKIFNTYIPNDGKYVLVGKYVSGNPYSDGRYYYFLKTLYMKKSGDVAVDKASLDFTDEDAFNTNTANGSWFRSRADDTYVKFLYYPDAEDDGRDYRQVYFYSYYDYGFMAFDLGTIADGDYKGKITYRKTANANLGGQWEMYLVKTNASVAKYTICGNYASDIHYTLNSVETNRTWEFNDKYLLSSIDCTGTSDSYWNVAEFEAEGLTAGRYYLVAKPATGVVKKYGYLQGFDMVPADFEYATAGTKADEEGAKLFGDNYAYIRKDGTDWVVSFFGGVKETVGYTEVGFEVKYNGGTVKAQDSGSVYSSLNVGGQNIAVSNFGADVEYIFTEEIALSDIDASEGIEFRAYAIDANGETVYGNTYTAVIE